MKIGGVVIALALLVSFASVSRGHSQQPAPRGTEGGHGEQAKPTDADKNASTKPAAAAPQPIIVNVAPPQKTEVEAEQDRRDRNDKATLDRRLVDLTGQLSAYTFGLFIATVLLVIATIGLVVMAVRQFFETRRLFVAEYRPLIVLRADPGRT